MWFAHFWTLVWESAVNSKQRNCELCSHSPSSAQVTNYASFIFRERRREGRMETHHAFVRIQTLLTLQATQQLLMNGLGSFPGWLHTLLHLHRYMCTEQSSLSELCVCTDSSIITGNFIIIIIKHLQWMSSAAQKIREKSKLQFRFSLVKSNLNKYEPHFLYLTGVFSEKLFTDSLYSVNTFKTNTFRNWCPQQTQTETNTEKVIQATFWKVPQFGD